MYKDIKNKTKRHKTCNLRSGVRVASIINKNALDNNGKTETIADKIKRYAYEVNEPFKIAQVAEFLGIDKSTLYAPLSTIRGIEVFMRLDHTKTEKGHSSHEYVSKNYLMAHPEYPLCEDDPRIIVEGQITFKEFWDAYGKKVGKKDALKRFQTLSATEKNLLAEVLPKYISDNSIAKFRDYPELFLMRLEIYKEKYLG